MIPTLSSTPLAEIAQLREQQRQFFRSGITRSLDFRKEMLRQLLASIKEHESEMLQALALDLGKSEFEAYSNEIGLVYSEIRYFLKHLKKWASPRRIFPDIALLPGIGKIHREPYGSVVIMAPWNYPMQLLFLPLVGAIGAGNTAILKPSEVAVHSAAVSQKIVESAFAPEFLALVQGGPEVSKALIEADFDYVFFTGSVPVGRQIMAAAAPLLTPLTLELGGKSPTFVHEDADIPVAARKIALGKFNNAGQSCVAPDYVLVHKSVAQNLIDELKTTITEFYGQDPSTSPNYGRIINHRHFDRISALMEGATFATGGQTDRETRYIAPTLLYPAQWSDKAMDDEIFGPVLPILEYEDLDEAITQVQNRPKPLALYVFSRDSKVAKRVTEAISFGGGGINSTLLHVASQKLPFGGVGPSGQGSYHGKASFECFSHVKSVLTQPTFIDLGLAYPNKNLGIEMVRRVFH